MFGKSYLSAEVPAPPPPPPPPPREDDPTFVPKPGATKNGSISGGWGVGMDAAFGFLFCGCTKHFKSLGHIYLLLKQ